MKKLDDTEKGWENKEGLGIHEMYCIFSLLCIWWGDLWSDFTVFSGHDLPLLKKITGTRKFWVVKVRVINL